MTESVVRVSSRIAIPLHEFEIEAVRSGGPGGQNVNKVSSKIRLRFNLRTSPSLTESLRHRATEALAHRLTNDGELLVSCDRFRDQPRNRDAAIASFRTLLAAALTPPRRRIATQPSIAARERRLTQKHVNADRKRNRRIVKADE